MAAYDVAIVGYGPVGATAALLLGGLGFRVVAVDSQDAIFDKPRAINLDHEVMRLLQFCGLAEAVAAQTEPHPGTDFLGLDGQIIKRFDPLPPPFPLGWAPNLVFIQPEFEALLRRAVAARGSAEVLLAHEAVELTQDDGRVRIELRDRASGAARRIEARWALGCDGAGSMVRRQLGIGHEDLAFDEEWLVVDALLTGAAVLPAKCIQYCRPSRPATFVIGPRNLRRWEIRLLPGDDRAQLATDAGIRALLAPFVDLRAIEIWRAAVYRFHAIVAARWRAGRVFLMGDAAHQTPPFLGQGLCSGLRDVGNLAWKLELVERHGAPGALLDSYEAERKPHMRAMVASAKNFGEIIGELDPEKARRRDTELERQLRSGEAVTVRQKYIPDLAGGIIDLDPDGCPRRAAGTLFVQPRLRETGGWEGLLDDRIEPRFLIVSDTAEAQDRLGEDARRLWRRIGGKRLIIAAAAARPAPASEILHFVESDGLFGNWLRGSGARAAVIRPDRYVYGLAADPDELNRLLAVLDDRLFGPHGRNV